MDLNNLHLASGKREELRRLLDKAHKDYQTNLDNLMDAAADEMETVLSRSPMDAQELVREYTADASQLTNDYYDDLRTLWSEYSSTPLPDFDHTTLVDSDRVLWQVQGGFSNTDFNGLTFSQVKAGKSRAGKTIEDLWPSFSNLDDSQQFIADMITASTRLTVQRDIRIDPTKPRWARVAGGSEPCAFCVMLAGRGFAYTSEDAADFGGSFHDGHCRCTIVPSWGADKALTSSQETWKSMYDAAKGDAEASSPSAVTQSMRRLYPDALRDGLYEISGEWPEDVVRPYARVWEHILGNHSPDSKIDGKTRFPDAWSEKKIKWAVMQTVTDPQRTREYDANREKRDRIVDGQIIRVWLQKTHATQRRYTVWTAYPISEQERARLWTAMQKREAPR
jgi:hypothetical protein